MFWNETLKTKVCIYLLYLSVQILGKYTVCPFSPLHEQDQKDLKRLSELYTETNNSLWQYPSLLLYASLSRNVV